MGNLYKKIILCVLVAFSVFLQDSAAQGLKSEEDLKVQANNFYKDEDYASAFPLYSQLLSLYPKDAQYNFRFGVCMLFTKEDKEKPIPYIEYASKKPIEDKDLSFFLGKAYRLNFRFDDAINSYKEFKKTASKSMQAQYQVDREIEACRNGKKLLKNFMDIEVIDKKVLSDREFFRTYNLSDIGGRLLVKPDEFKSSMDRKMKEKSFVYLAQTNNKIYYSSYGDKGANGRDIYLVRKLPSGKWSKPQVLPAPVNTAYDEDYPFLHPNGKTLYFASKGHNSMGGYDLFKTIFDEGNNTWSVPENLGFPINTPDDDILFVTDSAEKTAYFSSTRASVAGDISVYKINIQRKPVDIAVINGIIKSSGSSVKSTITVKNIENEEIVGKYTPKPENGAYVINLANGGKFLFTVKTDGFKSQSEIVELPKLTAFRPFRQEISYEKGTKRMILKNFFEETSDDSSYLLALDVIKEKARLNINTSEQALASEVKKTNAVTNSGTLATTNEKLPDQALVKSAFDEAQKASDEAKAIRPRTDKAYFVAQASKEIADADKQEADYIEKDLKNIKNTEDWKKQNARMNELKKNNKEKSLETIVAFNIARDLEAQASAKEKEARLKLSYAKGLENSVKANNSKEALEQVASQKSVLDNFLNEQSENLSLYATTMARAEEKEKEIKKSENRSKAIQDELNDLVKEYENQKALADQTNNDQVKAGILEQAAELEADISQKKNELAINNKKTDELKEEEKIIKDEAALVTSISNKLETVNVTKPVAAADKAKIEKQVESFQAQNVKPEEKSLASNTATKENIQKENKLSELSPEQAINDSFAENEKKILQISDTYEKEKNKAKLYNDWAAALDKEGEAKREELAQTKDAEIKKILVEEIKSIETASMEKKKLAVESLELASVTKEKTSVVNSESENNNLNNPEKAIVSVSYNDFFTQKLIDNEKITNASEKENNKAAIYKQWGDSLSREVSVKNDLLKKEKNSTKQKLLRDEIKGLTAKANEKRNLSAASSASSASLALEKTPLEKTGSEIKINEPINVTANEAVKISYTSPEAEKMSLKADNAMKELAVLNKQVTELKAKPALTEIEKADLSGKEQLVRQKESEIALITQESNQKEYDARKSTLEKLSVAVIDLKSEDKLAIENLKTTSENNFKDAEEMRGIARLETDPVMKVKEDQKALRSEVAAIESQQKIADIYSKYVSVATIEKIKSENTNTPEQKTATEEKTNEPINVTANEAVKIAYTSSEAEKMSLQADSTKKEIAILNKQVAELKAKPALTETEKTELSGKEQLVKQKESEIALITQASNQKEYEARKIIIEKLSAAVTDLKPEDKLAVENLKTASENNFKDAEEMRGISKSETDPVMKVKEDQKAYRSEMAAITDQQKITDIYAKYASVATLEKAKSENTNPIEQKPRTEEKTNEPINVPSNEAKKITYTSSEAEKMSLQADNAMKELAVLNKQVAELKAKPALTEIEKADLAGKEQLVRQKESEIALITQESNQKEYDARKSTLEKLSVAVTDLKPEDKLAIENLKTTSENNFKDAEEMRGIARSETDPGMKVKEEQKALRSEVSAIESQQKIADIYSKYVSVATIEKIKSENTNTPEQKTATEEKTNEPINVPANEAVKIAYTSSEAEKMSLQADSAMKELAVLNKQVADLKAKPALTKTEKTELSGKEQLVRQKESEIALISQASNQKEYDARKSIIEKLYAEVTDLKPEDKLEIEKLKASSENNFKDAEEMHSIARSETDPVMKVKEEQKASRSEAAAINEQEKIYTVYSSYVSAEGILRLSKRDTMEIVKAGQKANNNENLNLPSGDKAKTGEAIRSSTEYIVYKQLVKEADELEVRSASENKNAEELNDQGQKQADLAAKSIALAENITDADEKDVELKKAEEFSKKSKIYLFQSDSILSVAKEYAASATSRRAKSDSLIASLDKSTGESILSFAAKENITNTSKLALNNDNRTTALINEKEPLKENVFEKTVIPVYSSKKPIPMAPKFPKGLVYKVQIGAFRKPIPQDLFKGIQPVTGEPTANGLVRYTAGLFVSFEGANKAKNDIRQMGYNDAFVVAYQDGKLISNSAARSLGVSSSALSANSREQAGSGSENLSNAGNENLSNDATNNSRTEEPVRIKSTGLNSLSGLMYTVQVGVYSKKIANPSINVSSLFSEETASGLIRYTTGIFKDAVSASEAKNKIVAQGVKDAFVTAYYNGKRISLADARRLLEAGSSFTDPGTIPAIVNKEQPAPVIPKPTDILFKVQVGAFREQVPNEIAEKFVAHSKEGISIYKDENGLTNYNLGEFKSYTEAAEAKKQLVDFPEAFVVAFKSGKKITIEEARKLLGD